MSRSSPSAPASATTAGPYPLSRASASSISPARSITHSAGVFASITASRCFFAVAALPVARVVAATPSRASPPAT